jgi:thymidylate kinase
MIISFDGNVYSGKTTIINNLSSLFGYNKINEHSFFIDNLTFDQTNFLATQSKFLEVDKARSTCLRNDIDLLDRSIISVAAHVYSMAKIGAIDKRKEFLKILKNNKNSLIFPDRYIYVESDHETSLIRCNSLKNYKDTGDIYLSEDYFNYIGIFNEKINGLKIKTDFKLNELEIKKINNKIFNHKISKVGKKQMIKKIEGAMLG